MSQSSGTWFRWATVALSSLLLCACNITSPIGSQKKYPLASTADDKVKVRLESTDKRLPQEPLAPAVARSTSPVQQVSHQHTNPESKHENKTKHETRSSKGTSQKMIRHGTNRAALTHDPLCQCSTCRAPAHPDLWGGSFMRIRGEYIHDGGDEEMKVEVGKRGEIFGLNQEDTVAVFDTERGGLRVQPTNRVSIYAPRFAAVRQIATPQGLERNTRAAGMQSPTVFGVQQELQSKKMLLQHLPSEISSSLSAANVLRERNRDMIFENTDVLLSTRGKLLPYEDFRIIRFGKYDNSQKARLAARINAAKVWSHEAALQVMINKKVSAVSQDQVGAKGTHVFEMPPGKAQLRIVKVASKHNALPGEMVDFTIRFDNLGTEPLRNVIIMDNLSSRLEYVKKSQQSSVKATFAATANEGESLVLKWLLDEPLPVKKGGIIKFRCRVR